MAATRRIYLDGVNDNRRWDALTHRPGDIIIATPAKCGTTWTQGIVGSLLFPDGNLPRPLFILSPWIDGRMEPAEAVAKRLDRQDHRRFIKTHTPADGVPWWPTARYIVVLRDGRDAFVSLQNHMARMRPEIVQQLRAEAERDGGQPLQWTGNAAEDFPHWLDGTDGVPGYLASWWPQRDEPNLLLVHYNDLKADLAAEMRRIADFIGVTLPDALWPAAIERCTFAAMRARGDEIGPLDAVFEGGAEGFFYKGTNGRWRDVLTPDLLDLYEERIRTDLSADAARWLEQGWRGAPG